MKHLFVVASILSIVFIFGLQLVSADPFTLCVKNSNGKMNRGALGDAPAKGECKNPNKWSEVTLATEKNVLDVDSELQMTQEQLDALDNQINAPDGIADKVQANESELDTLKAGGISSLIGGSQSEGGPFSPAGTSILYAPMFTTGLSEMESEVTSKLAAAGHITRLAVVLNEPNPGQSLYRLAINGTPEALQPGTGLAGICPIGNNGTMCETEGCLKVKLGDTLSLHMQFTHGEDATLPAGRWTARFVETDADCPLLEE